MELLILLGIFSLIGALIVVVMEDEAGRRAKRAFRRKHLPVKHDLQNEEAKEAPWRWN